MEEIINFLGANVAWIAFGIGIGTGFIGKMFRDYFKQLQPLNILIDANRTWKMKHGKLKDSKWIWEKTKNKANEETKIGEKYDTNPLGKPIYVLCEGEGENIDILKKHKPTKSGKELSQLILDGEWFGENKQRLLAQGAFIDKKIIIVVVAVVAIAAIIVLLQFKLI